jgi:hypothetical protein
MAETIRINICCVLVRKFLQSVSRLGLLFPYAAKKVVAQIYLGLSELCKIKLIFFLNIQLLLHSRTIHKFPLRADLI